MGAKALFFFLTFSVMVALMAFGLSFNKPKTDPTEGVRLDLTNHTPAKTLEDIISDAEQNNLEQQKTTP